MAAVLDRPDAIVVQAARPAQRVEMPASLAAISRAPCSRPVPSSTAARACVRLLSVGALPRSYEVTPKVLGRRRATEPFEPGQEVDERSEGQPAASPRTNRIGPTTPPNTDDDDTDSALRATSGCAGPASKQQPSYRCPHARCRCRCSSGAGAARLTIEALAPTQSHSGPPGDAANPRRRSARLDNHPPRAEDRLSRREALWPGSTSIAARSRAR
jgi:hypothetical protein